MAAMTSCPRRSGVPRLHLPVTVIRLRNQPRSRCPRSRDDHLASASDDLGDERLARPIGWSCVGTRSDLERAELAPAEDKRNVARVIMLLGTRLRMSESLNGARTVRVGAAFTNSEHSRRPLAYRARSLLSPDAGAICRRLCRTHATAQSWIPGRSLWLPLHADPGDRSTPNSDHRLAPASDPVPARSIVGCRAGWSDRCRRRRCSRHLRVTARVVAPSGSAATDRLLRTRHEQRKTPPERGFCESG